MFPPSQIVTTISQYLVTVPHGEIVSHDDLRNLIPENLQAGYYGFMTRARARVLRENGAVFRPVRSEGYMRLNGPGGVEHAIYEPMKKGERLTRRGLKTLKQASRGVNMPRELSRRASDAQAVLEMSHALFRSRRTPPAAGTSRVRPNGPDDNLDGLRKLLPP
jgi:hypothetical protein